MSIASQPGVNSGDDFLYLGNAASSLGVVVGDNPAAPLGPAPLEIINAASPPLNVLVNGLPITTGGPYAPLSIVSATFVTVNTEVGLPNSRHLAAGSGIALADGGSGGAITISTTAPPALAPNFSEFYALMPGDNAATIAINARLLLPQNGQTQGGGITRASAGSFQLAAAGFYEVSWQVSVDEAAQMLLWVDLGTVVGAGVAPAKIPYTVVGRATGTNQLVGRSILRTTAPNTVISLRNGASASALTITPTAGGTDPVSANIIIRQLA